MKVCDALRSVTFETDAVIVKTGEKADRMFFVEDGEVKVMRTVSEYIYIQIYLPSKGGQPYLV